MIDGVPEKIILKHPGRSRERPESAWTFRTTEIAGGGWFKRNGHGVTPLDTLFGPFADVVAAYNLEVVPHTAKGQLLQEIHTIVPVELRHGRKIRKVSGEL